VEIIQKKLGVVKHEEFHFFVRNNRDADKNIPGKWIRLLKLFYMVFNHQIAF